MTVGYTVFDTPIGACGLAWRDGAVIGTALPGSSAERTRAHLAKRFPDAVESPVPEELRVVVDDVVALLSGEARDLRTAPLDYRDVPEFNRRAYDVARAIPPGKVLTYGNIAHQLGAPGSAQAVGQAMGNNPFPIIVPCHRVLGAGKSTGGFSAPGGVETKRRMLVIEGAIPEEPTLF
ncbi:methylated-DNA-[protein]-cysteine S-methyltransferase [Amycolatopsis echigonensis]|uniref:methylated-DNA--[protein]-cysteine S-methyltransferase n=1 Tax=Amycolatopsis echigonensis TaxID=2576905 RepID=A0A2N3WCP3_9PSEU|nr:methylated-DNA--[protein]-cysteine S-methyltransferase [Amycolatopsis niigatensis]PKV91638.1 methylated-DNA-[protein]-cysteine S-methyltransferase [Amycolatopsis niigatensis]